MGSEQPLQVARCTKIINPGTLLCITTICNMETLLTPLPNCILRTLYCMHVCELKKWKIYLGTEDAKYMINVRQLAKYVVALGEKLVQPILMKG